VTQGRIKRRRAATLAQAQAPTFEQSKVCALCDRPIPPALRDAHHLIPKSRGGVITVDMHRACHKQIHALFTETQLARNYASLQALRAHAELVRFINWVRDKPSEFNPPARRSRNKGLS